LEDSHLPDISPSIAITQASEIHSGQHKNSTYYSQDSGISNH
jgi:hypothetical protein